MFRYIPLVVLLVVALAGCTLSGDTAETPTPDVNSTATPTETQTPQNGSELITTPNVSSLDNVPDTPTESRPTPVDTDGDGVPDRTDYAPRDPNVQDKSDVVTDVDTTPTETPTPTPEPTPEVIRVEDPEFSVETYGPRYPDGNFEIDIEITNPHECSLTARVSAVALFGDDSATGDRQADLLGDDRPWVQQPIEPGNTWRIDDVSYTGPNEVQDHDVDVEVVELMETTEDYVECEK